MFLVSPNNFAMVNEEDADQPQRVALDPSGEEQMQICTISPSPASARPAFVLPFRSRGRFPVEAASPSMYSPSSSIDLQCMATSVTAQQDDQRMQDIEKNDDNNDEDLFVLLAPPSLMLGQEDGHSHLSSIKSMPRGVLRPRPLRMRPMQNFWANEEERLSPPPHTGKTVYLDASFSAPKVPLMEPPVAKHDVRKALAARDASTCLALKPVHCRTNILEDQITASTIKQQVDIPNYDNFRTETSQAIPSSHQILSTPRHQIVESSRSYSLPSPPSPPPFSDFLCTMTPDSGILCSSFM